MSLNIKVGGVWKSAIPKVKVSGAWREVQQAYVKVSGVWKSLLSRIYDISPLFDNYVIHSVTEQNAITSDEQVWMSQDGLRLFTARVFGLGFPVDEIQSYTLTSPFDLTTLVYHGPYDHSATLEHPTGLWISDDGMNMFVMGVIPGSEYGRDHRIRKYTFGTPFDIFTVTDSGQEHVISSGYVSMGNLFLKPDGTKLYTCSYNTVIEWGMSTPFDLTTLTQTFSTFTGQFRRSGMSRDGTKLYYGGTEGAYYNLSTPWDLSSIDTFSSGVVRIRWISDPNFTLINEDYAYMSSQNYPNVHCIIKRVNPNRAMFEKESLGYDDETQYVFHEYSYISPDGLKAFYRENDGIYQVNLTTPWVLPDANPPTIAKSYLTPSGNMSVRHFQFINDGHGMIIAHTNGYYEYVLSTSYDLNTMSYTGYFKLFQDLTVYPNYFFSICEDAGTLYGSTTNRIIKYTFGEKFNPETLTHTQSSEQLPFYYGVSRDAEGIITGRLERIDEEQPLINLDESKIVLSMDENGILTQFDMTTPGDLSTITTSIDTWTSASNPSEARFFSVSKHQGNDPPYTMGRINFCNWIDGGRKIISTDYNDEATVMTISKHQGEYPSLPLAVYTGFSYNMSSHLGSSGTNSPLDITFSGDGTRLYFMVYRGPISTTIMEHRLSTPWDIRTAHWSSPNAINSEFYYGDSDASLNTITFKPDGTKMFMAVSGVGGISDIREYNLSTPNDLRTASFLRKSTLSVSPYHISFSDDGTLLTVIDNSFNRIAQQYQLSTPWNITTQTELTTRSYEYKAEDGFNISHLDISSDGTKYLAYESGNAIHEYIMTTPYDISTSVYQDNFVVPYQITKIEGLAMHVAPNGKDLYFLRGSGTVAIVYQYEIL